MFGKLLSTTLKIVTLPIDAAEIALDFATGGDGNRGDLRNAVPLASELRDKIAETAESIDN